MKYQIECGNLTTSIEATHWSEALKKAFKKHKGWFGELARFRTYKDRAWKYVAPENYIPK